MEVYKFGGASVKDAAGVINLAHIVKMAAGQPLLIVVSAMGKTTNALESLTHAYVNHDPGIQQLFSSIKEYHYDIARQLFHDENVLDDLNNTFVEVDWMLEEDPHDDYDFIYDQIVSIGEMAATRIVNAYLNYAGVKSTWLDVRGYIHTDNTYREGTVDMAQSCAAITRDLPVLLQKQNIVTQGFLGGTSENFTTTLGREGSDYTAAIFAACLGAKAVTTWKDVPGILNADPKLFSNTVKFDELTYNEAIEMTYYGATVIHPKTIKPLQNAGIPLLVKSFNNPDSEGTIITENARQHFAKPVIIVKPQQVLLSLSAKDYSFITEDHLGLIFQLFARQRVHINLMQTSALSFSVCFNADKERFEVLLSTLKEHFKVKYNGGLTLFTLRHYQPEDLRSVTNGKTIFLEQVSRNTAQVLF